MEKGETHFIARQLYRSIAHSLEQLVFFEATVHGDSPEDDPISDALAYAVEITEPAKGRLYIVGEKALFPEMTEQFFGKNDSKCQHDLSCELTNTIAGHLMAKLFPNEVFRLGLPYQQEGKPPPAATSIHASCYIEGRKFQALITGDELIANAQGPNPQDNADCTQAECDDPFAEADACWGQGPEADPQTGQWPATRRWGS